MCMASLEFISALNLCTGYFVYASAQFALQGKKDIEVVIMMRPVLKCSVLKINRIRILSKICLPRPTPAFRDCSWVLGAFIMSVSWVFSGRPLGLTRLGGQQRHTLVATLP